MSPDHERDNRRDAERDQHPTPHTYPRRSWEQTTADDWDEIDWRDL